MLSTYCQHCGSKNEYRFTKPKFCSSCGKALSLINDEVETKTVKSVKKIQTREANLDTEGTDVYEVPDISSLEYEIDIPNTSSFSLGSLFSNAQVESHGATTPKKRGRPRKRNGKTA